MRILGLLEEFQVHATFFVLGWVAESLPRLVMEIAQRGHEIASHGYGHQRIYNRTREEFRKDIRRSKDILEGVSGVKVLGYRAPSYSISKETLWAYDELCDAGYHYDSSVFPIRHDLYGIPDWPRFPFTVEKGPDGKWQPASQSTNRYSLDADCWSLTSNRYSLDADNILEIPITTLSLGGKYIPIAGGGYFRLFPYPFTRWGLRRINRQEGRPFVFYLHPWEIDPSQPRINGAGAKSRFRHYLNLDKTEARLRKLLSDFKFAPISKMPFSHSAHSESAVLNGLRRPGVGRYAGINVD
jgi:polysaccharide deacetylase family protein (PEP-CTERM system associated)